MELTEQQKLEILCAYLPYGIEVRADKSVYEGFTAPLVLSNSTNSLKNGYVVATALDYGVQPILRHPDDISGEELVQLGRILWGDDSHTKEFARNDAKDWLRGTMRPFMSYKTAQKATMYLWSIHIDTFGAIEAEFAIRKTNIQE
jgi:hypothetical protein